MKLSPLEIQEPNMCALQVTCPLTQNEYTYFSTGWVSKPAIVFAKLVNGQTIDLSRKYPTYIGASEMIEAHRRAYLQPHIEKEISYGGEERQEAKQQDQDSRLNDLFNAHEEIARQVNDLYRKLSRLHIESLEIQAMLKQYAKLPKKFGTTSFNVG